MGMLTVIMLGSLALIISLWALLAAYEAQASANIANFRVKELENAKEKHHDSHGHSSE